MSLLSTLSKNQANIFIEDNDLYMRCLPVLSTPKSILIGYYKALIFMNKITKLEDLPEKEKQGIWEMAKEFAAGRLKNNEEMINLCRCLYCLEYILNK